MFETNFPELGNGSGPEVDPHQAPSSSSSESYAIDPPDFKLGITREERSSLPTSAATSTASHNSRLENMRQTVKDMKLSPSQQAILDAYYRTSARDAFLEARRRRRLRQEAEEAAAAAERGEKVKPATKSTVAAPRPRQRAREPKVPDPSLSFREHVLKLLEEEAVSVVRTSRGNRWSYKREPDQDRPLPKPTKRFIQLLEILTKSHERANDMVADPEHPDRPPPEVESDPYPSSGDEGFPSQQELDNAKEVLGWLREDRNTRNRPAVSPTPSELAVPEALTANDLQTMSGMVADRILDRLAQREQSNQSSGKPPSPTSQQQASPPVPLRPSVTPAPQDSDRSRLDNVEQPETKPQQRHSQQPLNQIGTPPAFYWYDVLHNTTTPVKRLSATPQPSSPRNAAEDTEVYFSPY